MAAAAAAAAAARTAGKRPTVVSNPFNVQHIIHVNFDSKTGFDGLPSEWEVLLSGSGITVDDVRANPESVLEVLSFEAKRQDVATVDVQFEKADGSVLPVAVSGVALADTADGPAGDAATSAAAPASGGASSSSSSSSAQRGAARRVAAAARRGSSQCCPT